MATPEEINKVIETTDMVELVSPYVKLMKQGKNYKGLCPFHNEDTPSFVVSQDKHLAHCFGCGKGGNPIKFLMDIKMISFQEALEELANKNGIPIEKTLKKKVEQDNSVFYEMMQTSAKFYHKNLTFTQSGKQALDYLFRRGIDEETIEEFQIGLAPASKDALYQVLKESNYLEMNMKDLGLVGFHENQGYYDIFSRRITFPITDEQGHIIGFSARLYDNPDKTQPKYINTMDTFLYHKGTVLYHLSQAKAEIMRKKRFILHEGQMDVIASCRSGLKETICTMGTALTIEQAYILKRYADHAIVCYDGDKAGIAASKKAIAIFKKAGIRTHLVLLPEGMDPDEYVSTYGKDAYVTFFEANIKDEFEYEFETAFLNQDLKDSFIIESVKSAIFLQILKLPSQTLKEKYLRLLAQRIGTSIAAISADYDAYFKHNSFIQDETYDDFDIPLEEKPKEILVPSKDYELRLFQYATKKEKALYIDKKIEEYMDAFSKVNQEIWVALINHHYIKYEEFNLAAFLSILTEEQKAVYLDNIEKVRNSKDPYSDEDLECIIRKMENDHVKVINQGLTEQAHQSNELEVKVSKVAEKFKNKKKSMPNRRK